MDIYFRGKHHGKEIDLRLHGTETQWQLEKKIKRKKNGKPVESWEPFRFYSSLSRALRCVSEAQFRQASTVEKAIERLEALAERIESDLHYPMVKAIHRAEALEANGEHRSPANS